MLLMAKIKKGDVLYDLGSGDGRIPIAAATQHGVHAVYRTVYLWTVPMHRTKTRTHHE
jgi:cyclopropane fatty-acyl-phospholipid synthase-like methyltransferase